MPVGTWPRDSDTKGDRWLTLGASSSPLALWVAASQSHAGLQGALPKRHLEIAGLGGGSARQASNSLAPLACCVPQRNALQKLGEVFSGVLAAASQAGVRVWKMAGTEGTRAECHMLR